ncbi:HAD-IIB family hydrolase [Paratractidigestivibacter sp.]|uniref:HAD-IIB family hydrolase n=1 Tax=Paratractidigestivibacter sp. TaxID=2847316 RepID=UPI002ABDABF9|nr:HAD-IIB family hydrolase [Paratractidigestivibacter sp.]
MIKLFAADLDGTLLNALHVTDPVILHSLRRVREAGRHFSIATGRTLRSNNALGFEGNVAVVCANGSLVLDEEGRLARVSMMPREFVEAIVREFPKTPLDYIGVEHTYHTGSEDEHAASYGHMPLWRKVVMRGMSMTGGPEHVYGCSPQDIAAQDICKINAHIKGMDEARALREFIDDWSDQVINAPFNPSMIEVTAKGVNKGEAVAWLADYLGVSQDEVAVYGDSGNDIQMLERFAARGHAYATSNGSDEAKRAAGNVIGPCALHAVPRHMLRSLR